MSNRQAYVEKIKAKIDEWSAEIDKIEAKARGAEADQKIKYEQQLSEMRMQREKARDKMHEISASSEDAWETLKDGMESAWGNVSKAFRDAANKFK